MPLTEPEPPMTVPVPAKTRCLAASCLAHGEALAHDRVVDEGVFVAGGDERLRMLLGARRRPRAASTRACRASSAATMQPADPPPMTT